MSVTEEEMNGSSEILMDCAKKMVIDFIISEGNIEIGLKDLQVTWFCKNDNGSWKAVVEDSVLNMTRYEVVFKSENKLIVIDIFEKIDIANPIEYTVVRSVASYLEF